MSHGVPTSVICVHDSGVVEHDVQATPGIQGLNHGLDV